MGRLVPDVSVTFYLGYKSFSESSSVGFSQLFWGASSGDGAQFGYMGIPGCEGAWDIEQIGLITIAQLIVCCWKHHIVFSNTTVVSLSEQLLLLGK